MKRFVALTIASCILALASQARATGESDGAFAPALPQIGVFDATPAPLELAGKPKLDASCDGYPAFSALHVSAQYATMARDRLTSLSQMSDSARASAWNGGHEEKWFGKYRESRFEKAREVMAKAASVLASSHLTMWCNKNISVWGQTFSDKFVPYGIVLGRYWMYGLPGLSALELAGERQLTIVHEAAHHGGANWIEFKGRYGLKDALERADHYPGTAVRTAENHAYYAVCRASASPACTP